MNRIIRNALISVSDKTDLIPLAQFLISKKINIISTGGTSKVLESHAIAYTPIESVTHNPECFNGRMKSISFPIASGILYRRECAQDELQLHQLGFPPIDLVVCNFYPFIEKVRAQVDATIEDLVEDIDIGGPLMVRAAAKNFNDVVVLASPEFYNNFMYHYDLNNGSTIEFRKNMSFEAFKYINEYDRTIVDKFELKKNLRYGENPHQKSMLQIRNKNMWDVLGGKELSYNNILDADSAWRILSELQHQLSDKKLFVCTIIKHGNPCGCVASNSKVESLSRAWHGGGKSSFGGIVAVNFEIDDELFKFFNDKFIEIIIAPKISVKIENINSTKKNIRFIKADFINMNIKEETFKSTFFGNLIQDEDKDIFKKDFFEVVTKNKFLDNATDLITFGIIVTKYLKSNAIALVASFKSIEKNIIGLDLLGAGMGQPNRFDSFLLALNRMNERKKSHEIIDTDISNTILISDAFFPFSDIVEYAFKENIKYIVQPGGSMQDQNIIDKSNELEISMIFTGMRHFRH